MAKPTTRHLDRAIREAIRKLEAVRNGEMWPLTSSERRAAFAALASGSYQVVRGKSPARADRKLETVSSAAETRLVTEITALQIERQRIVNEAAAAKSAKKSSRWW